MMWRLYFVHHTAGCEGAEGFSDSENEAGTGRVEVDGRGAGIGANCGFEEDPRRMREERCSAVEGPGPALLLDPVESIGCDVGNSLNFRSRPPALVVPLPLPGVLLFCAPATGPRPAGDGDAPIYVRPGPYPWPDTDGTKVDPAKYAVLLPGVADSLTRAEGVVGVSNPALMGEGAIISAPLPPCPP